MKKRSLIIIAFALFTSCILLLSACSPTVVISHTNIRRFGYLADTADGKGLIERCTYEVKTEERSFTTELETPAVYLIGTGTYVTELYFNGGTEYRYETRLTFYGQYVYTQNTPAKGDDKLSETFTDTVVGSSAFTLNESTFNAVSSTRTFTNAVPQLKDGVYTLEYPEITFKATYDASGHSNKLGVTSEVSEISKSGDFAVTENNKSFTFTAGSSGSCSPTPHRLYDNEHILLGIRVQTLPENFFDTLTVIDQAAASARKLSVATALIDPNNADSGKVRLITYAGKNTANPTDPATGTRMPDGDYTCLKLSASLDGRYKGKNIDMYITTPEFAYSYAIDEKGTKLDTPTPVNVVMEFTQEYLRYTLSDYENFALKAA